MESKCPRSRDARFMAIVTDMYMMDVVLHQIVPLVRFVHEMKLWSTLYIALIIAKEIIYGFTSSSRIFHLYGDVTIADEGLQDLGLCLALRTFKQEEIFIVPYLLWHGTWDFPVSPEGPLHLVAFYDTQGDVENLF